MIPDSVSTQKVSDVTKGTGHNVNVNGRWCNIDCSIDWNNHGANYQYEADFKIIEMASLILDT